MWWWVLAWVVLVLLAYLWARARGLWAHVVALGEELERAQARLEDVQGQLELLGERVRAPEDLAVFTSPATARTERDRSRQQGQQARRARRAKHRAMPARHVD